MRVTDERRKISENIKGLGYLGLIYLCICHRYLDKSIRYFDK
jgi:hypothetical protein